MGCSVKCVGAVGLTFTIIFGILGIAGLVLACVNFKATDFSWVDGAKWKSLGGITISSVCIVLFIMIFGIIEFTCCIGSRAFSVFYVILQMLCLLFSIIIAIIGLVVSDTGKIEDYVGCNKNYTGLFKYWNNMDTLLKYIDVEFCSADCPCSFNSTATEAFEANATVKPTFDKYVKTGTAKKFSDCPAEVQKRAQDKFDFQERLTGNHLKKLDIKKFADYWEYIEKKFECTGWCQSEYTYIEDPNKETHYFYKYLYYGTDNGIVKKTGCLGSILDWVRPRLQVYGIVSFICSLIEIVTFILGISLVCGCCEIKGNSIPQDDKKNEKNTNSSIPNGNNKKQDSETVKLYSSKKT